jgi:hypothetical protein
MSAPAILSRSCHDCCNQAIAQACAVYSPGDRRVNECNGDITSIDTAPYRAGGSDNFLFADQSGLARVCFNKVINKVIE